MKKRNICIIFLMALALLFSSCQAVFQDDWSNEAGDLPAWTRSPHVKKGHTAYVSKGKGTNEDEARLDAMKNLLKEMSDDLGWDAYTVYWRELTTTDAVEDFSGSIEKTHFRNHEGQTSCWILFQAESERLDSMRTIEQKEYFEREEDIARLIDGASECYRENRDAEALEKILDALLLSLDGGDMEGAENLLSIAMRYLEPLEFRVEQEGSDVGSTIRVIRDKGLFSPKVKNAPVVFYYERSTTTGGRERDSVKVTSGESGTYTFVNTDPYIRRIGEVTVSLALDYQKLYEIDEKAGMEFLRPFWDMLGKKTVSYTYDIREKGALRGDLEAVITEYDMNGRERIEGSALGEFASFAAEEHIGLPVSRGMGEDDESIMQAFALSHPGHRRYLAVIRLGIVENVSILGKEASHAEGSLNIIDTVTGESVLFDDTIQAVGYGATTEEAEDSALEAGGRIALSVLMIEFLD